MKEIYAWVPWFQELVKKINEGGEDYLASQAEKIDWNTKNKKEAPILAYLKKNIDPFSFIYTIASKNDTRIQKPLYGSIGEKFDIDSTDILLPNSVKYGCHFPTPMGVGTFFHNGSEESSKLLWKLFRQVAQPSGEIESDDIFQTLQISGVAVKKLTQTMFLINPLRFMPVDDSTTCFNHALGLHSTADVIKQIEDKDNAWSNYQSILERFKLSFPGCRFYEINDALYRMGRWNKRRSDNVNLFHNFFHISTDILNDREDQWKEFVDNNYVRTDGKASGISFDSNENPQSPYPLDKPTKGDIILVRFGTENGRAIGIVVKNDYAEEGLYKDSSIHVLWLNKQSATLNGQTQQDAIGPVSEKSETYKAFSETAEYTSTFNLIDSIKDYIKLIDSGASEIVIEKPKVSPSPSKKHPLNQIFYGPPGTGKTYHTINAALEIIDPEFLKKNRNNRSELRKRFDQLKNEEQIAFVTFHQSFGYEEFVEGIRPVMEGEEEQIVSYEIKNGVFKRLSDRSASTKPTIAFDDAIEKLKEDVSEESVTIKSIMGKNLELKYPGNTTFRIRPESGEVFGPVNIDLIKRAYQGADTKGFYHRFYIRAIINYIKDHYNINDSEPARTPGRYVLIIDEINRGNISRIFGELITLIEESKRLGNDEATTVTLPYSGEIFGVPNNLYIIGTMNTADRSIALLDTALRRRFRFTEMMPNSALLKDIEIEGINISKLLDAINGRIESLYDRDHQIGHSFFMGLKDKTNIGALNDVFQYDVLPLLQEYFYDDWAKIDLVLNRNKFLTSNPPEKLPNNDFIDSEKKLWSIETDNFTPENYKKIYQGKDDE